MRPLVLGFKVTQLGKAEASKAFRFRIAMLKLRLDRLINLKQGIAIHANGVVIECAASCIMGVGLDPKPPTALLHKLAFDTFMPVPSLHTSAGVPATTSYVSVVLGLLCQ